MTLIVRRVFLAAGVVPALGRAPDKPADQPLGFFSDPTQGARLPTR